MNTTVTTSDAGIVIDTDPFTLAQALIDICKMAGLLPPCFDPHLGLQVLSVAEGERCQITIGYAPDGPIAGDERIPNVAAFTPEIEAFLDKVMPTMGVTFAWECPACYEAVEHGERGQYIACEHCGHRFTAGDEG